MAIGETYFKMWIGRGDKIAALETKLRIAREALEVAKKDLLGVQATTMGDYDSVSLLGQDVFDNCYYAIERLDAALRSEGGD